MAARDVVHRLRNRANQAQDEGQLHVAHDLRIAIATIIRMDAELTKHETRQRAGLPLSILQHGGRPRVF
jgi:hypothetical protein